jgi:4-hydroxyphenylacetate 3-monooxygenase
LAGGGLIMLPASEADLLDPQTAADIARTQSSPTAAPLERVQFYKLAWDAIGSEFASRHVQHEKFYAGANFVTRAHAFRTFDWDASNQMVDAMLARSPPPVPRRA